MEENKTVVDTYRLPETKALLKRMTDPRPHKLAGAFLKAKIRMLLSSHEKQALWTRPVDDLSYLAVDGLQGAGALGGSQVGRRIARMVAPGSPRAEVLGWIGGAMAGSTIAGGLGKKVVDTAVQKADAVGMLPEALTHVNIMSDRQSKWSNIGSAVGIAAAVPLSLRLLMKSKGSPLGAVAGSLGSAYLLSRAGNAAGNIAGYYADRNADTDTTEE